MNSFNIPSIWRTNRLENQSKVTDILLVEVNKLKNEKWINIWDLSANANKKELEDFLKSHNLFKDIVNNNETLKEWYWRQL
jgi:hypothetical protein